MKIKLHGKGPTEKRQLNDNKLIIPLIEFECEFLNVDYFQLPYFEITKESKEKIDWKKLRCTEASMFSRETKIDCGKPAEFIIWHNSDRRAYAMCDSCADHNVKNRGGIELARKEV